MNKCVKSFLKISFKKGTCLYVINYNIWKYFSISFYYPIKISCYSLDFLFFFSTWFSFLNSACTYFQALSLSVGSSRNQCSLLSLSMPLRIDPHPVTWIYITSICCNFHLYIYKCRRCKRHGFDSWVRKIPWKREWQPTPVFLSRKFRG